MGKSSLQAALLMIWLTPAASLAQDLILPGVGSIPLGKDHLEYFEDPDQKLSIQEVSSEEFSNRFIKVDANTLNLGYSSSAYWLRFKLKNPNPQDRTFILELAYALIDDFRLYIPTSSSGFSERRSGRLIPVKVKEIPTRYSAFHVALEGDSEKTFYIRVVSKDSMPLPITLRTEADYRQSEHSDQFVLGLYYGIVVIMALFNLFVFFTIRDKPYIYYVLTVTFLHGCFMLGINGYTYEFLGHLSMWWSRGCIAFFFSVGMIFSVLFTKSFMDAPRSTPLLNRLLNFGIAWALLEALLSFIVDYSFAIQSAVVMGMYNAGLIWLTGFVNLSKGNRSAIFFMLAWSWLLLGGCAYAVKVWAIAPSNWFTEHFWQLGSVFDMVLLSLALGDRINIIRREKDQAQQEALENLRKADKLKEEYSRSLEQKVEERTAELSVANDNLQKVNENLNDFTYIVSHDLQEPLRAIESYSKFIIEDYSPLLKGEGKNFLERIRANTKRMRDFIERLLEYSRIVRIKNQYEEVECSVLWQELREIFSVLLEEKQIHLVIQTVPKKIWCDRTRITQLFQNLIGNAIKFSDKPHSTVEVGGADEGNGFYRFYVKDAGIGIAEKYFEQIFQMFKRLHTREEYPGTGAGLTICKKIVESHQGKIWVESQVGRGSTFYFTLPKQMG